MQMLLEILKVLVSWPMVALVTLVLLVLFRRRVALLADRLIDRVIRSEKTKAVVGPFTIEIGKAKAVEIAEQIVGKSPLPAPDKLPTPAYLSVLGADPNLALVGLRIEIEKRLRRLCNRRRLPEVASINELFRNLRRADVLDDELYHGLEWIITAGNRAAHGAKVDDGVTGWAVQYGPRILASLDELTEKTEQ